MILQNVFLKAALICLGYAVIRVTCSPGDRSQFFVNCVRGCKSKNCTNDGIEFKHPAEQDYFNHLLLWSCEDECSYYCMWRTTNSFVARNWNVPQFYGKWPFQRWFGIQEPASVTFSLLNFGVHCKMIMMLRRQVRSDSPMFYVWHALCGICLNGWIWSTVFHTRDYPLTELFDYAFAYSMVLGMTCCMFLRMMHSQSVLIKTTVIIIAVVYFLNHFANLSVGNFDYAYNMRANIVTGVIGGIGWIVWCALRRKTKTYAWKMFAFQLLAAASLSLELLDFPPIWWTFDAHSLWHLSTAPLTVLLYSFAIDDCKSLRREMMSQVDVDDKDKLI